MNSFFFFFDFLCYLSTVSSQKMEKGNWISNQAWGKHFCYCDELLLQ